MAITIKVDLGKYKEVDLELDKAVEFVKKAIEKRGKTRDLEETLRYITNFDEFYSYMKKKFKDFIAPPKLSREVVEGKVFVHKLKLYIDERGSKRVLFVIDRRVPTDIIKEILSEIGFKEVNIEKMLF